MALRRHVLKFPNIYVRHFQTLLPRKKSITGYQTADNALQTVTGGRINRWLDAYEDLVGLTEVRLAQDSVTKAEANYRDVQTERRKTQQQLTTVQSKIKAIATDIEKTKRGTDAYLDLVTKENEIIREEKEILEQVAVIEEREKHFFGLLSSAVRESHEKERARAERLKYWGIMGSLIGACIGILGTSVNNYLRMKELRNIVTKATDMNQSHREKSMELYMNVNEQYGKIYQILADVRSAMGVNLSVSHNASSQEPAAVIDKDAKLDEVIDALKSQEKSLNAEMSNIKNLVAVRLSEEHAEASEGTVVYVGPEVESMLKDTEKHIEKKMTMHTIGTVTLIYAVAALSIPILLKMFGGS